MSENVRLGGRKCVGDEGWGGVVFSRQSGEADIKLHCLTDSVCHCSHVSASRLPISTDSPFQRINT